MTSDSEIITRSREVPSTFAELYEKYGRMILAYARGRVGIDEAEDVAAETFLIAFRKRADFDTNWESAKPWLLGIATRLCQKHGVRQAIHLRAAATAAVAADPNDSSAEADARMDAAAALSALLPRINALAAGDRDALVLYAWHNLTYEELAIALDIPVGTVRSRLNRVRRKLAHPRPHAIRPMAWVPNGETDAP